MRSISSRSAATAGVHVSAQGKHVAITADSIIPGPMASTVRVPDATCVVRPLSVTLRAQVNQLRENARSKFCELYM